MRRAYSTSEPPTQPPSWLSTRSNKRQRTQQQLDDSPPDTSTPLPRPYSLDNWRPSSGTDFLGAHVRRAFGAPLNTFASSTAASSPLPSPPAATTEMDAATRELGHAAAEAMMTGARREDASWPTRSASLPPPSAAAPPRPARPDISELPYDLAHSPSPAYASSTADSRKTAGSTAYLDALAHLDFGSALGLDWPPSAAGTARASSPHWRESGSHARAAQQQHPPPSISLPSLPPPAAAVGSTTAPLSILPKSRTYDGSTQAYDPASWYAPHPGLQHRPSSTLVGSPAMHDEVDLGNTSADETNANADTSLPSFKFSKDAAMYSPACGSNAVAGGGADEVARFEDQICYADEEDVSEDVSREQARRGDLREEKSRFSWADDSFSMEDGETLAGSGSEGGGKARRRKRAQTNLSVRRRTLVALGLGGTTTGMDTSEKARPPEEDGDERRGGGGKKRRRGIIIAALIAIAVIVVVLAVTLGVVLSRDDQDKASGAAPASTSTGTAATDGADGSINELEGLAGNFSTLSTDATTPRNRLVIFGASYCDNAHGRPERLEGTLQPSPNWEGRHSDGPVWDEYLRDYLAANANGTEVELVNYAYGGAMVDNDITPGNVPDTDTQMLAYSRDLASGALPALPEGSDLLALVWVGLNPVFQAWSQATNGYTDASATALDSAVKIVNDSADALVTSLVALRQNASIDLMVLPINPPEMIPRAIALANSDSAQLDFVQSLGRAYNTRLVNGVVAELYPDASSTTLFDVYGWFYGVQADPTSVSTRGLAVNMTDPCWLRSEGTVCADQTAHFWWDDMHLEHDAHAAFAQALLPSVESLWAQ